MLWTKLSSQYYECRAGDRRHAVPLYRMRQALRQHPLDRARDGQARGPQHVHRWQAARHAEDVRGLPRGRYVRRGRPVDGCRRASQAAHHRRLPELNDRRQL